MNCSTATAIFRRFAAAAILASALLGCTPATTTPSGVVVWGVDESAALSRDSAPLLENSIFSAASGRVRLRAAINETVAAQLALRAEKPPQAAVNVLFSDLVGPLATLPAREVLALFRAQPVRIDAFRSWYPDAANRPTDPLTVLDILVPWDAPRGGGPVRLESRATEVLWLDVRVPPGTPPGLYRGSIDIVTGSAGAGGMFDSGPQALRKLTLELTVEPVAIPAARSTPFVARVDPRDLLENQLNWPTTSPEETRLFVNEPVHQAGVRLVRSAMGVLHDHRLSPVLWASFPKYQLTSAGDVEIDWTEYDALVGPWIEGAEFTDRLQSEIWPLPVSIDYPSADRNGGFTSPRYSRALGQYVKACVQHFQQRGWLERAILRPLPPEPLDVRSISRAERVSGILRQADIAVPTLFHLPVRSLRPLGWVNAPTVALPDTAIWCPPAMLWEAEAVARERGLGKRIWCIPDEPPYSPSLRVEAPIVDPRTLAWQAFRYELDGVWLEYPADVGRLSNPSRTAPLDRNPDSLVYPGGEYGLVSAVVPSVRLKRLRRGLYDLELLHLLDRGGKSHLARRTAAQIVRWAFSEAADLNLLTTREIGWLGDAQALALARNLLLQELVNDFAGSKEGAESQISNLADWATLVAQSAVVRVEPRGVRFESGEKSIAAHVFLVTSNGTDRPLTGKFRFDALPPGWSRAQDEPLTLAAGRRALNRVDFQLPGTGYDSNGHIRMKVALDAQTGLFESAFQAALVSAPTVERPPTIDGNLSDWLMSASNSLGDFRLVRGAGRAAAPATEPRVPTHPTRAFVAMDDGNLYFAVRCSVGRGETTRWSADNQIPIDGAIPWGQDLVEIILSPQNAITGTGDELLVLQIKPSGFLASHRGTPTNPPMSSVTPWTSNARTAVRIDDDGWTAELAIPLTAFEATTLRNRIWGCNVTRLDAARGEYSSWSGARGNSYIPETLGNLVLPMP